MSVRVFLPPHPLDAPCPRCLVHPQWAHVERCVGVHITGSGQTAVLTPCECPLTAADFTPEPAGVGR